MATITDYEQVDYEAIRAVLVGITLADARAKIGQGWVGFFEDGEFAEELLQPNPTPSAPRTFVRWGKAYEEVEVMLDGDSVVRRGVARLALRYQRGTAMGLRIAFWKLVRERFKAASDEESMAYLVEAPVEPRDPQAGFAVEELPLTFVGVS